MRAARSAPYIRAYPCCNAERAQDHDVNLTTCGLLRGSTCNALPDPGTVFYHAARVIFCAGLRILWRDGRCMHLTHSSGNMAAQQMHGRALHSARSRLTFALRRGVAFVYAAPPPTGRDLRATVRTSCDCVVVCALRIAGCACS